MIAIKNNNNRVNALKIIFYLMMGLEIISAYSNIMQYQLLSVPSHGGTITEAMAVANDHRQRIIAIINICLLIATVTSFIMWFHRAYKNLHALNITTLNFTPGWAIGAWFVPFLNLGRPYVIMREIWEETQEYTLPKEEKFMIASPLIVGWWWGVWIFDNIVGNISSRLPQKSIEELILSTQFSIAANVTGMISMILTLIMIVRMQEYEIKLWNYVQEKSVNINDSGSMNVSGV